MQNWRMISFAAGEMEGSAGKETGLVTILVRQIVLDKVHDSSRLRRDYNEIRTVCRSLLGSSAKMVDILSRIRISRYPKPTNQQLSYGLSIV